MISAKFEDEIWIYFQTNLRARTRKEYWNVIRSFDKLTGHDPLKLTRKEAMNYYNSLIEKVNSGRLSYNTAVMRLSVMKSVCTFIETYTINHGKRYVNHFESMSLPEQDKILPKDAIKPSVSAKPCGNERSRTVFKYCLPVTTSPNAAHTSA